MFIPLIATMLALAGLPQATIQVAVGDPELPSGPLVAFGPMQEGDLYIEAASVVRSDIPGMVDGTAVIVTDDATAPLWVMTFWVRCDRHVYQVGSGRRYDWAGREVRPDVWVPDQPIAPDTGVEAAEAAFCKTSGPDLSDRPVVADYHAALAAHASPTP